MLNGESENAQDARLEELWRKLDTSQRGYLDLSGLKKGLRKMDHPLKNANSLLEDVLLAIDTNHDGRISYAEFRSFVKQTEQELWSMFESIDHNGDGRLDKDELQAAFRSAGLAVPKAKLLRFFDEIDANHDGEVSFDEWRDFLLFIPASDPNLQQILSYFSSTITLNAEGDAQISYETIEGTGTIIQFLRPFFGALITIAQPPRRTLLDGDDTTLPTDYPSLPDELSLQSQSTMPESLTSAHKQFAEEDWVQPPSLKLVLTDRFPRIGYFVAGGIAGAISRTTTAPLDRLKVYLIAQTNDKHDAIRAAKSGAPLQALRGAWRTMSGAMVELWAAGGVRSLFAGNGLNVVKIMPESAIKFGSYEAVKRAWQSFGLKDDSKSKYVAGGISGMIAQGSVYPLDTLKFRMQCEMVSGGLHGNRLIVETARKMWRTNGVRAFYRGLPMGMIGIFPYAAIDMGTFEYLKHAVAVRNAKIAGCHEEDTPPSSLQMAFVGAFSGALGASMVYPLNVLRTRLQSQGTVLHPRTYTGIVDVFRQTLQGEGYRGLFKGLAPNLLKVVPAVSISWVVYENMKKEMGLH